MLFNTNFMKTLSSIFSLIVILSIISCSAIKDETYSKYSDINPISAKKTYIFKNFPIIDTIKINPKYKAEVILDASIWKKVKPSFKPKNDEWKYSVVEINIEDERHVNFVLKNVNGKIIGSKKSRYKKKNNFIELNKQIVADPMYIALWILGSQRLALGINNQNELKILNKNDIFFMLIFMPTFGGGNLEDSNFKMEK